MQTKDQYKLSRILYIIEAALEYFVSIAVSTSYLPKIGLAMGMSESYITILTSIISLGCFFQLGALFLADKTPVKTWVTTLHIISQVFFALIWFIPCFKGSVVFLTVIFTIILVSAYILHNLANSPKIAWYMALVPDEKRGSFTGTKEIVSLISGAIFTIAYGVVIDHFEETEQTTLGFAVCGIIVIVVMLLHTLTLVFSKEKPVERKNVPATDALKRVLKNKKYMRSIPLMAMRGAMTYSILPFMAVYQYSVLGMTATGVSAIVMITCLARVFVEKPFGKLGDKTSFAFMYRFCQFFYVAGYIIIVVFSPLMNWGMMDKVGPIIGIVIVGGFNLCTAIAAGGDGNAMMNMSYELVNKEDRTSAYAIYNAVAGISGFLMTLIMTGINALYPAEMYIFGLRVYPIQINAIIAIIICVGAIIYSSLIMEKAKQ